MNAARFIRSLLTYGCLIAASIGAGTAHPSALDGYQFCEAPAAGTRAYVSPVFDGAATNPQVSFARYLAARYQLADVHARCFRLASEHEAQQFRTQRIEILYWDGWQHVVATSWTPQAAAVVAGNAGRD
jgi:hypothetical protein